jgi:surface antigen
MPVQFLVDHNTKVIRQDKNMSCWYASAQMVLAYRGVTNMIVQTSSNIGTLARYFKNDGVFANEFTTFASEVGLSWRKGSDVLPVTSAIGWAKTLRVLGPLWVPIMVTEGKHTYGHIVVVRGVRSDGTLWINDPAKLVPIGTDAAQFNAAACWALPFLFKFSAGPLF